MLKEFFKVEKGIPQKCITPMVAASPFPIIFFSNLINLIPQFPGYSRLEQNFLADFCPCSRSIAHLAPQNNYLHHFHTCSIWNLIFLNAILFLSPYSPSRFYQSSSFISIFLLNIFYVYFYYSCLSLGP